MRNISIEDIKEIMLQKLVKHYFLTGENAIPYYIAFRFGRELKLNGKLTRQVLFELCFDGYVEFDGDGKIIIKLSDKSF